MLGGDLDVSRRDRLHAMNQRSHGIERDDSNAV